VGNSIHCIRVVILGVPYLDALSLRRIDVYGKDNHLHHAGSVYSRRTDIEVTWFIYLLRCADNSLYCGVTNDIDRRIKKHSTGKGAKYTRSRLPVELVWQSSGVDKSTAHKAEYYIKQRSKNQKEMLTLGRGQLHDALLEHFGILHR